MVIMAGKVVCPLCRAVYLKKGQQFLDMTVTLRTLSYTPIPKSKKRNIFQTRIGLQPCLENLYIRRATHHWSGFLTSYYSGYLACY
jgi:hypothetical protein